MPPMTPTDNRAIDPEALSRRAFLTKTAALAVTRLFSNDLSAASLLGERPSLASVRKATLIPVSSPTVVFEPSSIVSISFRRVWRALDSVEFDERLVVLPESVELVVALLVAAVEAFAWCAAACKCATA